MKTILILFIVLFPVAPLAAQMYPHGALRLGITGGANVGGEEATAKYANYTPHPYGTLTLEHYASDDIAVTAALFAGTLSAEISGRAQFPAYGDRLITAYDAKYYGLSGGLNFVLPTLIGFTPYLRPRLGFLVHQTRVDGEGGFEERLSRAALTYGFGGGIEYPIARNIAFTFGYDLVLTNSDDIDGLRSGDKNDALSVFTAGINVLIRPGGDTERLRRPLEQRFSTLQPTATPRGEALPRARAAKDSLRGPAEEDRDDAALQTGESDPNSPVIGETVPLRSAQAGEAQQLRGLTLGQAPAIPDEDARAVGDGGSLQLFTQLRVTPLQRLSDLEKDPSLLTLHAAQTGTSRMQLKCSVELLRDGATFYQGNADLLLDGTEDVFDAEALINLKTLLDRNDGYALLPRGNYLVRISAVAWDHDLSSLSKAKFLNADLRPIFGPRETEAREVITREAVDIALEGSDELLVNFFKATESATERMLIEKRTPERLRAPLRLAPVSLTGTPREQYLATQVEQSLNEGLKLQSIAGSIGRARNLKLILSEVFFPIDSDMLNEESRIVLDNVARLLNQHPELFAEIRGYASDVGDESYNRMLADRRAQRVLEYLVRQKLNAYRIAAGSSGSLPPAALTGEDARLGRKVEIVLRNRGM